MKNTTPLDDNNTQPLATPGQGNVSRRTSTSHVRRRIFLAGGLLLAATGAALLSAGSPGAKYVAHEWGTFTSVQGGDGVLLDWRPLESSRLPGFVYDWTRPGLSRQPAGALGSKAGIVTLQRMETPVIYFYSPTAQTIDVSVQFPKGLITEWYPQAAQIGPSTVPVPPAIARLDNLVHKVGVSPQFTFASFRNNSAVKASKVRWANIEVLPENQNQQLGASLLKDRSGSHYFAARETDSDYLRASSLSTTNPSPELEKFIFYRGVGSFGTPLRVTMSSEDSVVVANTSDEPLGHLFVLQVHEGAGRFLYVEHLGPGEQKAVKLDGSAPNLQVEALSRQIGERMAQSLVKEGLYAREASAMVKTWNESWFQEEGLRVLYVLPRAWTDRTLPLTLEPAPRELVRVMVGRAEVITPQVQQQLTESLIKAADGDAQARDIAVEELKRLGRFGEPALALSTKGASKEVKEIGWTLFRAAAAKPAEQAKAF